MATILKSLHCSFLHSKFVWLPAAAFAVVTFLATPAFAASYTWDASGTNPTSPTDGSGTWGTSLNWSNGTSDVAWLSGNSVVFGTGTGAAGIVNLGASTTVTNITFNPAGSGNYTIAGGSGPYTLTLSSASAITANTNATISAKLAGTTIALTETGAGTLTLSGANTFTGSVTVNAGSIDFTNSNSYVGNTSITNGGSIELDFTGSNTGATRLNASTALSFTGGGTFSVLGTNTASQTTSQTVNGVTFNAGAASISDTVGGGQP